MRVSPQAEWGESPRESVTVMRPWGDKSGQLRAMQGLCHDRSRRNTSCQVYCIRAVHWLHGFLSAPAGIGSLPLHHTGVSAALLLFGSQDLCTSPPVQTCRNNARALAVWEPAGARLSLWGSDTPLELRSYEICIKNVRFHILDRENSGRRKRNESILQCWGWIGSAGSKSRGRSAGRWTRSSVRSPFRRVRATSTRCLKGAGRPARHDPRARGCR